MCGTLCQKKKKKIKPDKKKQKNKQIKVTYLVRGKERENDYLFI